MTLRAEIQADIAEAYDTDLADAVTAFTGTREVVGEYDPITGEQPTETTTYQGRGVMGGYSAEEIDGQHILATDVKLSGVLQNELLLIEGGQPTTPAEPKVGDAVAGYRVERVGQDPAKSTWTLQLRRT